MNPDIKARWIAALRGGQYKQADGALKRLEPDGELKYCCLGVLCELWLEDHPGNGWDMINRDERTGKDDETIPRIVGRLDTEESFLPNVVMTWAGLDSHTGAWAEADERGENNLAELNDNGETFDDIAEVIEREF